MNFAQTELLIHVVNRDTNRILDVDRWVGSGRSTCLPGAREGTHRKRPMTPSGLLCGALAQRWAGLVESLWV